MVCMWVLLGHDARKAKGMKRKIFDIIEPDRNNSVASRIFDRDKFQVHRETGRTEDGFKTSS